MVLVSVSIHEARVSSTFFGGLKASRTWKLKKIIILENIKSNELSFVFSKIVSKGLCCDKVWRISIFPSCTPIRGIYRKSLLRCAPNHVLIEKTSRLYQIHCLTRQKLRINFKHALFHGLSHSWQAITGTKSDLNGSHLWLHQ